MKIYNVQNILDEGVPSETRFMFHKIVNHLEAPHEISKRILCLFGLRRTGKTVLLRQSIRYLIEHGVAPGNIHYLEMEPGDDFEALYDYANPRAQKGVYFFVDQIGNAGCFVMKAQILFDALTEAYGAKMVLTGTNSLAVWLTGTSALFDRSEIIDVPYLTFYEHCRFVLKITEPTTDNLFAYMLNGGFFGKNEMTQFNYIQESIIEPLVKTVEIDDTVVFCRDAEDYDWRAITRDVLILSAQSIRNKQLHADTNLYPDYLSLDISSDKELQKKFLEYMGMRTSRDKLFMKHNEVSAILSLLERLGVIFKLPNKSTTCEPSKWFVQIPFLRSEITAQLAAFENKELLLKGPLLGTLFERLVISEWAAAHDSKSLWFIRHLVDATKPYEIDMLDDARKLLIEIKVSEEQANRYTGFYKLQEYLQQECSDYERRIITMRDIPFIYSLGKQAYASSGVGSGEIKS